MTIPLDNYERHGDSLTTLLELNDPAIRQQVSQMRLWRRRQLRQILRPARADLRLPLAQAVALAILMTNHVEELGPGAEETIETTASGLEAARFDTAHAES